MLANICSRQHFQRHFLQALLEVEEIKFPFFSAKACCVHSKLRLFSTCFDAGKINLYSKTCLKRPLSKRPKIGFQDQLWLNAGQKYCRMLQGEHSAILSTFIKLPFVIKDFVLSIFVWSLKTGFTVLRINVRYL